MSWPHELCRDHRRRARRLCISRLLKYLCASSHYRSAVLSRSRLCSPSITPTPSVTPFQSGSPIAQVSFTLRFAPIYASNISIFNQQTTVIDIRSDIQNLLQQVLADGALSAVFPGAAGAGPAPGAVPQWLPTTAVLITPPTSTQPYVDASVAIYTSSAALAPLLASTVTAALGPAFRSRRSTLTTTENFLKYLVQANVTGALQRSTAAQLTPITCRNDSNEMMILSLELSARVSHPGSPLQV